MRVRDPWQIAVENVTSRGTSPRLPANVRECRSGCELRDDEGFPHLCAFGDFLIEDDGTIIVAGLPRGDGRTLRLAATLHRRTN